MILAIIRMEVLSEKCMELSQTIASLSGSIEDGEGMQAHRVNHALAASFLRSFWLPSLKGRPSASAMAAQLRGAALGALGKGIDPVHRKAITNAKCLACTKFR